MSITTVSVVIAVVIVLIIGLDWYLATDRVLANTISARFLVWSQAQLGELLPYMWFVIAGHIWLSQYAWVHGNVWIPIALGVLIALGSLPVPVVCAIGLAVGALTWPNLGINGE